MPFFVFIGLIVAACFGWLVYSHVKKSRRNSLFVTPLPPESIHILENNVALYSRLPKELKQELHGRINIFLDEKEFTGLKGLDITEEIRLTIAGNACLLLLGLDKRRFPGFTSLLIYPDTYVAKEVTTDGVVEMHEESTRAGESWYRGPIVLSWADVMRGTLNGNSGHNVVLHEFAHKLDEENHIMDGLPVLRDRSHYAEWAEVLSKEYDSLQERAERGTNTVMDAYGTVSPAEFFAVATESFFEKAVAMKNKLPDLYQQLKRFYNLDPASWQ